MFHHKLKELRKLNGLTQSQLAKEINVSQQCVSDWETGKNEPPVKHILQLAKLFSVSIDNLLDVNSDCILYVSGFSEEEIRLLQTFLDSLHDN